MNTKNITPTTPTSPTSQAQEAPVNQGLTREARAERLLGDTYVANHMLGFLTLIDRAIASSELSNSSLINPNSNNPLELTRHLQEALLDDCMKLLKTDTSKDLPELQTLVFLQHVKQQLLSSQSDKDVETHLMEALKKLLPELFRSCEDYSVTYTLPALSTENLEHLNHKDALVLMIGLLRALGGEVSLELLTQIFAQIATSDKQQNGDRNYIYDPHEKIAAHIVAILRQQGLTEEHRKLIEGCISYSQNPIRNSSICSELFSELGCLFGSNTRFCAAYIEKLEQAIKELHTKEELNDADRTALRSLLHSLNGLIETCPSTQQIALCLQASEAAQSAMILCDLVQAVQKDLFGTGLPVWKHAMALLKNNKNEEDNYTLIPALSNALNALPENGSTIKYRAEFIQYILDHYTPSNYGSVVQTQHQLDRRQAGVITYVLEPVPLNEEGIKLWSLYFDRVAQVVQELEEGLENGTLEIITIGEATGPTITPEQLPQYINEHITEFIHHAVANMEGHAITQGSQANKLLTLLLECAQKLSNYENLSLSNLHSERTEEDYLRSIGGLGCVLGDLVGWLSRQPVDEHTQAHWAKVIELFNSLENPQAVEEAITAMLAKILWTNYCDKEHAIMIALAQKVYAYIGIDFFAKFFEGFRQRANTLAEVELLNAFDEVWANQQGTQDPEDSNADDVNSID